MLKVKRNGLDLGLLTRYSTYGLLFLIFQLRILEKNLFNNFLWLDESGQVWMSLGQNHFSPVGTESHGITDILTNNSTYNLDPGGFTLLLRVWMELFGFEAPVLRLLPYSAYLLTFLLIQIAMMRTFRNSNLKEIATLLLIFVSTTPMVSYYAFEIRGYSFSLLLSTILFVTLSNYIFNRSSTNFLILCSFICISISIRYTSISYCVAITFIVVTLEIYSRNIRRFLLIVTSTLCMSTGIVISQLRFQFGGSADSYLAEHMLFGNSNIFTILKDNFVGFPGFLRLIVVLLSLYILFSLRRLSFSELLNKREFIFSMVALLVTFFQISLSALGIIPWHSSTRWAIEDLSFLFVFIILVNSESLGSRLFSKGLIWSRYIKYLPSLFLISLLVLVFSRESVAAIIQRNSNLQISRVLFSGLNEKSKNDVVLIESNLYPTLRYNFELDSRYKNISSSWFSSSIHLYSNSKELRNLLVNRSERPLTIIASNQEWVHETIDQSSLKCSSRLDANEMDSRAPHWFSLKGC